MNPDITPMELVINTMIDIIRFYDNSDGLLNSDYIIRNVQSCLALTVEEIQDKYKGEIQYLKETTKPKKGIIYYSKKHHTKQCTYQILDDLYNNEYSVIQNLTILEEDLGFSIGKSTIYEYLSNRKIKSDNKKLTDDELLEFTDFSISAISNLEYIKSLGYKIGNKRYNKIYKEYKNKNEEDARTTTLNIKMENDTINDNQETYSENSSFSYSIPNFNNTEVDFYKAS